MKNISMRLEGQYLVMKVDLSKTFGESRTGKTEVVATTHGNIDVPGQSECGIKIGVNVFKYPGTPKFKVMNKSPTVKKKRGRIRVK